jgi:hypothetical protein
MELDSLFTLPGGGDRRILPSLEGVMTRLTVVGIVLFTLPAIASAQNEVVRVSVSGGNGFPATLTASAQPYFEGGPVANMYLPSGIDARTRDGRPIVGFAFTAWMEGDATRGQIFALVGASGSPDVDLRYRADLVERTEFASYRLRPGESVPITEMRSLGLEPMVVQAETLREIAARLELLMTSLRLR